MLALCQNVGALLKSGRFIEMLVFYGKVGALWNCQHSMKMSWLYENNSAIWKSLCFMKMSGPCTTRDKKIYNNYKMTDFDIYAFFYNHNFRISKHFNNFWIRNLTVETSLLGTLYLYPIHDTTHSHHSEFIRLIGEKHSINQQLWAEFYHVYLVFEDSCLNIRMYLHTFRNIDFPLFVYTSIQQALIV